MQMKVCADCMSITEHKYIDTIKKIIPNYRPHSGKRLLTSREATEIIEIWKCLKCGKEDRFSKGISY
jgi:protein-arginine kinase activator protein McsA